MESSKIMTHVEVSACSTLCNVFRFLLLTHYPASYGMDKENITRGLTDGTESHDNSGNWPEDWVVEPHP